MTYLQAYLFTRFDDLNYILWFFWWGIFAWLIIMLVIIYVDYSNHYSYIECKKSYYKDFKYHFYMKYKHENPDVYLKETEEDYEKIVQKYGSGSI